MIIFSLRRFKGGEDKYMTPVGEWSADAMPLAGWICAANGDVKTSRTDEHLSMRHEVQITDPKRLVPMNAESKTWLAEFIELTKETP